MPDLAASRDRRWLVLAVLCLSVFLVVVDNTIVNVALPTLNRHLGASISALQWIVDAYSLAFAGLLLAGGGIGDRLGTKGHHAGRPDLLWIVLCHSGVQHDDRHPDRSAGADGCGGGVHLPGEPGHPDEHLQRPIRAAEGAGDLGSDLGHRRRLRAHHRAAHCSSTSGTARSSSSTCPS